MAEQITREEWLAELERLQQQGRQDEGRTARELAEVWKCSTKLALIRLQRLAAEGRLAVGRRRGFRLDGTAYLTPVYRLKKIGTGKASGT